MPSSLSSTSAYTLMIDWSLWASVQPAGQWAPSNQWTRTSRLAFGLGTDAAPPVISAPTTAECPVPLWRRSEEPCGRAIQVPNSSGNHAYIWLSAHSDFARIKSSNAVFAVVLCQMTQFWAPACFGVNPREGGASICLDRCGPSKKWCLVRTPAPCSCGPLCLLCGFLVAMSHF